MKQKLLIVFLATQSLFFVQKNMAQTEELPRLDSITIVTVDEAEGSRISKKYFKYDDRQNLIENKSVDCNQSNIKQVTSGVITSMKYNTLNQEIENIQSTYDYIIKEWVPTVKREYTYLSNGLKDTEIFCIYAKKLKKYINHTQEKYVYNADKSIKTISSSIYDPSLEKWKENKKQAYKYNSTGKLIEISFKEKNDQDNYIEKKKFIKEYDNNLLQKRIENVLNAETKKLYTNKKTEYKYNEKGLETEHINFVWEDNALQKTSKVEIKYSENNTITIDSLLTYPVEEKWKIVNRVEKKFDANQNVISLNTSEKLFDNNNPIQLTERISATYDNDVKTKDIIFPVKFAGYNEIGYQHPINNKILKAKKEHYYDGVWKEYDHYTYYYSNTENNVGITPTAKELTINFFPNPASDFINIETSKSIIGATLSICDLKGRVLFQQENFKGGQVNIRHFTKGFYICSLTKGNIVYKKKLLKK
ncbi:MAG: T9SS type A sorting domain-containing protein [Bacteroidales bacterium]